MMFYIMLFLANNEGLEGSYGGRTLKTFLIFGAVIIGIFSAILLFYTNNFLMKRRKKELGIFIVLGMEKRHLGMVQFFETLYVGGISIIAGVCLGIGFSRLTLSLLTKMAHISTPLVFSVDIYAVALVAALFAAIYLIIFFFNIVSVGRAKPIDILKGGNVGEKEPKTKWALTITGILALGGGYAIALLVKDPMSAILLFFLAVLLVIAGTYLLFTTGSISVLKAMRGRKDFYYKTRHFINVSGMIYRMRQNAVGLGNICILSTMVLVMVSTTLALNIGVEDILDGRFPHEITISYQAPEEDTLETTINKIEVFAEKEGVVLAALEYDRYFSLGTGFPGSILSSEAVAHDGEMSNIRLTVISDAEYSGKTGNKIELAPGEALTFTKEVYLDDTLFLYGIRFSNAGSVTDFPMPAGMEEYEGYADGGVRLVVAEEDFARIIEAHSRENESRYGDMLQIHIDTNLPEAEQKAFSEKLMLEIAEKVTGEYINEDGSTGTYEYSSINAQSRAGDAENFYSLYGGFLFLGISLGLMFLMATILIVYYKQITEGYNDKERFVIMQKVGLSKSGIKRSIRSQILMVFFLPLIVSVIHVAAAFNIITQLLALLDLTNVGLFAICTASTIGVFALIYLLVFVVTAREYYKIVSQ